MQEFLGSFSVYDWLWRDDKDKVTTHTYHTSIEVDPPKICWDSRRMDDSIDKVLTSLSVVESILNTYHTYYMAERHYRHFHSPPSLALCYSNVIVISLSLLLWCGQSYKAFMAQTPSLDDYKGRLHYFGKVSDMDT